MAWLDESRDVAFTHPQNTNEEFSATHPVALLVALVSAIILSEKLKIVGGSYRPALCPER